AGVQQYFRATHLHGALAIRTAPLGAGTLRVADLHLRYSKPDLNAGRIHLAVVAGYRKPGSRPDQRRGTSDGTRIRLLRHRQSAVERDVCVEASLVSGAGSRRAVEDSRPV